MKKIISLLVALVLIVGCTGVTTFAASPEKDSLVTVYEALDNNNNKVDFGLIETDLDDEDLQPSSKDEAVIGIFKVKVSGDVEYPVTVTIAADGVKTSSKAYILAKDADGNVKKIEVEILKDGVIKFVLDKEYTFLSVIVDKKSSTNRGESDKTGDGVTPIVMTIAFISVVGMAVSLKKVKEN